MEITGWIGSMGVRQFSVVLAYVMSLRTPLFLETCRSANPETLGGTRGVMATLISRGSVGRLNTSSTAQGRKQ